MLNERPDRTGEKKKESWTQGFNQDCQHWRDTSTQVLCASEKTNKRQELKVKRKNEAETEDRKNRVVEI